MSTRRRCPALLVVAPASGQGKTTVTAALARRYRDRGLRVRAFKIGPDFLDPMILERATGHPVYQLDLWMGGEDHCRGLLYDAAREADLILVEGVMGLFDGEHSSADLAMLFDIPILAVIDGNAMAQTFGAVAHGLATHRPGLPLAGVFANRVAGERHHRMLAASLPPGLTDRGWLAHDADIALPERHLGLLQADELGDLDIRIAHAAAALNATDSVRPSEVTFTAPVLDVLPPQLANVRIAVARDAAFSFIYPANLALLQALGGELVFFSPLDDDRLPQCDALYLPGGYPELHLERLASNVSMQRAIRAFHAAGRPIVAECGGMLYLADSLTDARGRRASMVGLLPGHAALQTRIANLGLQHAVLPEGALKGHTFHYSIMTGATAPVTRSRSYGGHGSGEPVYRQRRLTASYLHWYFPSNPTVTARLFLP